MLGNTGSIGKTPSFKAVAVDQRNILQKIGEEEFEQYLSGEINLRGLGKFEVKDGRDGYVAEDPEISAIKTPLENCFILYSKAPSHEQEKREQELEKKYLNSGIKAMYYPNNLILNLQQLKEKHEETMKNLAELRKMHRKPSERPSLKVMI